MGSSEKKGVTYSPEDINRMSFLLKQIESARLELAEIQHYHHSYSIMRVCEPASSIVKIALGEEIRWTA